MDKGTSTALGTATKIGPAMPHPTASPGRRGGLEVLSVDECYRLLDGHHVGRLGFTYRSLPIVFPVNYVVDEQSIVFDTEAPSVLSAAIAGDVACLEIDDHDDLTHEGWTVLATGHLYEVSSAEEIEAVQHLPLVPWRQMRSPHYIRLRAELVSGRRLLPFAEPDLEA